MKPKPGNRKINQIKLKFMDCSIELKDKKPNIEQRAINLMAALIQYRIRFYEVMQTLNESADEQELDKKNKRKTVMPDIEFMRAYS